MKAAPGPKVLLVTAMALVGTLLTGCTDDTGAIDQKGHNGYDQRACSDVAAMANDVRHDAMTVGQASAEADRLAATAQRGGDPMVRAAGAHLAAAYHPRDPRKVSRALTEFATACDW